MGENGHVLYLKVSVGNWHNIGRAKTFTEWGSWASIVDEEYEGLSDPSQKGWKDTLVSTEYGKETRGWRTLRSQQLEETFPMLGDTQWLVKSKDSAMDWTDSVPNVEDLTLIGWVFEEGAFGLDEATAVRLLWSHADTLVFVLHSPYVMN